MKVIGNNFSKYIPFRQKTTPFMQSESLFADEDVYIWLLEKGWESLCCREDLPKSIWLF